MINVYAVHLPKRQLPSHCVLLKDGITDYGTKLLLTIVVLQSDDSLAQTGWR